jgi:hypothetical protein
VGVASITSFAVLRVEAEHELDHLRATCSPNCSYSSTERGRNFALAADLSLGIGVAALAGAAAWTLGSWLWHGRGRTSVAWLPMHRGTLEALTTRS